VHTGVILLEKTAADEFSDRLIVPFAVDEVQRLFVRNILEFHWLIQRRIENWKREARDLEH
jgi:hypothetical protein